MARHELRLYQHKEEKEGAIRHAWLQLWLNVTSEQRLSGHLKALAHQGRAKNFFLLFIFQSPTDLAGCVLATSESTFFLLSIGSPSILGTSLSVLLVAHKAVNGLAASYYPDLWHSYFPSLSPGSVDKSLLVLLKARQKSAVAVVACPKTLERADPPLDEMSP